MSEDTIKARVLEAQRDMEREHSGQVAKIQESHRKEIEALNAKIAESEAAREKAEQEQTKVSESVTALEAKIEEMKKDLDSEREKGAIAETLQVVNARLAQSDLPEAAAKRVRQVFEGKAAKVEDIDKIIEAQVEFIRELGVGPRTVVGAGTSAGSAPDPSDLDREASAVSEAFVSNFAAMMGNSLDD